MPTDQKDVKAPASRQSGEWETCPLCCGSGEDDSGHGLPWGECLWCRGSGEVYVEWSEDDD